jgi:hypothetical protein
LYSWFFDNSKEINPFEQIRAAQVVPVKYSYQVRTEEDIGWLEKLEYCKGRMKTLKLGFGRSNYSTSI